MIDFRTARPTTDWARAKPYTKQSHLYIDVKPLEQSPIDMKLRFRCKNNPSCKTHFCRLIGWEYMEAFRAFRIKYGSDAEGIAKIKEAIVSRFSDSSSSAFALLGTHSRYPVWMIGQLYFFKKDLPQMLF